MYGNQSFDEKVTGVTRNDDYDLCNTETGQKFVIKWSPQDGARYLSKNRYASPRSVSKSVPRCNRGLVRYNINRSLNFDVGSRSSDNFKSPNSSSDSNASVDGDRYLSRSSKILRALNINYSPLRKTKSTARKINKSLNFDLSPSPKRLGSFSKNSRINSHGKNRNTSSKINKTLNFDTSSNESNLNGSAINSSPESIDENQNQTPSQRNRTAKKSLNYLSPSSVKSFGSDDSNARLPMLRRRIGDDDENVVANIATPNVLSTRKIVGNDKIDCFGASTPRNLFNDYDDDDDDERDDDDDDERPRTPENVVRIIPESMSAIKKSHKKERLMGRIERLVPYEIDPSSESQTFDDSSLDTPRINPRPITPSIVIDKYQSPQCGPSSIKKSHKKDKSKKNFFAHRSDDEMSDTGSIFDYTEETSTIPVTPNPSSTDKNLRGLKNLEKSNSYANENEKSPKNEEENFFPSTDKSNANASFVEDKTVETSTKVEQSTPLRVRKNSKTTRNVDESTNQQNADSCIHTVDNSSTTPPKKSTIPDSPRPLTPENRVNFLQRIMTNSIKKSHKKIKDTNKKMLFKPRIIRNDEESMKNRENVDDDDDNVVISDVDRATTPENTNSSRLLIGQFSSVKKSHRKDKHRRMITGSMQRKKSRTIDEPSNSDNDANNCSFSSSASDFPNLATSTIIPDNVDKRETPSNDFSSDSSNDGVYRNSAKSPTKIFDSRAINVESSTLVSEKSSPKKRKNFLNVSSTNEASKSSCNLNFASMEYENVEEEFKIFTPIKKRKSLNIVAPLARRICDATLDDVKLVKESSMENVDSRCSTPITAREKYVEKIEKNFQTPERKTNEISVTLTDYSSEIRSRDDDNDDPSGRSTPQNSSTAVLMAGINSIKKSHKKDKRGDVSRRSLIRQQHEDELESISRSENDSSGCFGQFRESPRPSTSHESTINREIVDDGKETNFQTKTPPNCLKIKEYMRLLQTSSIKRSHKKVREGKKFLTIVGDRDSSDGSSIFDEGEISLAMENEDTKEDEGDDDDDESRNVCLETNVDGIGRRERNLCRNDDAVSSNYTVNLSDDGSSFDNDDKLESTYKNDNSCEPENDIV